mgnify:CR=1 FL=1
MGNFKDLNVWQCGMSFATAVYAFVKKLPADEKIGLIDQIRRATFSIPSNIVEGSGRNSSKEFRHFLSIAIGSLAELETQLLLCCSVGYYITEDLNNILAQIDELRNRLYAFLKRLSSDIQQTTANN